MGIHPEQVEILGRFGPPQLSLGGLRVWPYVVSTGNETTHRPSRLTWGHGTGIRELFARGSQRGPERCRSRR